MEPRKLENVIYSRAMTEERSADLHDSELVRRTKRGDIVAFEELFNRHQKRVYNLIYRMINDPTEAADLTQDVFVRAFNSVGRLRDEDAFSAWLRTVAVNICKDHIRRKPPRTQSLDAKVQLDDGEVSIDVPDTSDGPEKRVLTLDRKERVRRAVQSLSPDYRLVVVLHHLEGVEIHNIAKMLNIPLGTVKSRLSRAREELKRKLVTYVE